MDALIFDFDGVIVDSEPVHMAAFQSVLAAVGVTLSPEDYYQRYIGFDDHDCFEAVGKETGAGFTERQIAEMTASKTALLKRAFAESISSMPGAAALIRAAAAVDIPLAICSGALREEITLAAGATRVLQFFQTIVSAEDVPRGRGKPDPAGYRLAAERLTAISGRTIDPARCVVVEDSPAGIDAAKALGMKVLAVTNSCPRDTLHAADHVVDSLNDVDVKALDALT